MATLEQSLSRQTSPRDLKIGLFMPCYVDLIYPKVGIATLELLERFGLDVDYPLNQTCCGQPMSNSGDQLNARGSNCDLAHVYCESQRKKYACLSAQSSQDAGRRCATKPSRLEVYSGPTACMICPISMALLDGISWREIASWSVAIPVRF